MGWGVRPRCVSLLGGVLVLAFVIAGVGVVRAGGRSGVDRRSDVAVTQKLSGAVKQASRTARNARSARAAGKPASPRLDPALVASVRQEADWILTAQLDNGAIAHFPDKVRVLPYVANFASIGLTRATAVTGDQRYVRASWRWLDWYASHQSSEAFVSDQIVSGGDTVSTGTMDSTDAYAGTFLYAVWSTWDLTRDDAHLARLAPAINGAITAMEATLDTDGLTWAKPDWRVKYLMDEAEVVVGWRSASALLRVLRDPRWSLMTTRANAAQAAIAQTWNDAAGGYDWAIHEDGARTATSWGTLYPDATQQMWAVGFGVAAPERAEELVNHFVSTHGDWASPDVLRQTAPDVDPYWPAAGWGMPDTIRKSAATSIIRDAVATGRGWPYHPAIAGQVIVLASGGPKLP